MKRIVLLVTAAAVALSPLAASAAPAKPTKRTLTFDYSGFQAGGVSSVGSFNYPGGCTVIDACWDFETVKGEKTIEVKAEDPDVGIQVWYDDAYADNVVLFCGSGKITVSPRASHVVSVRPSLHDCGSVPTEGTLTAVITGTK